MFRVTLLSAMLLSLLGCSQTFEAPRNGFLNGGSETPVVGSEAFDVEPYPESYLLGKQQYQTHCADCHGDEGQGANSPSLIDCNSCGSLESLILKIVNTMPTYQPSDCASEGDCAENVARYILDVLNTEEDIFPSPIENNGPVSEATDLETLYKSTLNLAGRLPTDAEMEQVQSQGESALSLVLDSLMREQGFADRVAEIYNDVMNTDYSVNGSSVDFMRGLISKDQMISWYEDISFRSERHWGRYTTPMSFSQDSLNLIKYIVKNDLPFSDILAADYMVVNYYTAKSYLLDVDELDFRRVPADEIHLRGGTFPVDGEHMGSSNFDPTDLRAVQMPEVWKNGHAGLLTTAAWINRHNSSRTNLNRHRAYSFFKQFLDTDLLEIEGDRENIDDAIGDEHPTLNNPACTSCHNIMDPVASTFQWWEDGRPELHDDTDYWQSNAILPAGFNGLETPVSSMASPLQWLAKQTVNDPRFAQSVVKHLFAGITGKSVLEMPEGTFATHENIIGYQQQNALIKDWSEQLAFNNFNIKPIVKNIILSSYYKTKASTRLLTPEMLSRKLLATTGQTWQYGSQFDRPQLSKFDGDSYATLYGGIDDKEVVERNADPSSSVAAIQRLIASELSCKAVGSDFARSDSERRFMLQGLSHNSAAIESEARQKITGLMWRFWGQVFSQNSAQVDAYYDLLTKLQTEGSLMVNAGQASGMLNDLCQFSYHPETGERLQTPIANDETFVIRSWMGVVQALLLDYRFLYE